MHVRQTAGKAAQCRGSFTLPPLAGGKAGGGPRGRSAGATAAALAAADVGSRGDGLWPSHARAGVGERGGDAVRELRAPYAGWVPEYAHGHSPLGVAQLTHQSCRANSAHFRLHVARPRPYRPALIQSATRSAIIIVVTLVLARTTSGMIDASATRRPDTPCTWPH